MGPHAHGYNVAWCDGHAMYRWTRTASIADVLKAAKSWLTNHRPDAHVGTLRSLSITIDGPRLPDLIQVVDRRCRTARVRTGIDGSAAGHERDGARRTAVESRRHQANVRDRNTAARAVAPLEAVRGGDAAART